MYGAKRMGFSAVDAFLANERADWIKMGCGKTR
jgi:hypothetical protein